VEESLPLREAVGVGEGASGANNMQNQKW